MREILFRARIKRAKCFCYSTVGTEYFPSFWYNLNTNPDDYVIMQYTGLKDKNGKMIFEGDMVKVDDGEHINRILSGEIGIIEYIPARFRLKVIRFNDFHMLQKDDSELLEIIGNKFENPELLEGK